MISFCCCSSRPTALPKSRRHVAVNLGNAVQCISSCSLNRAGNTHRQGGDDVVAAMLTRSTQVWLDGMRWRLVDIGAP